MEIAAAASHHTRVRILRYLWEEVDGGIASPSTMAEEWGELIGTVSHHVKKLVDLGLVEEYGTERRGSALEHLYELTERGMEAMR